MSPRVTMNQLRRQMRAELERQVNALLLGETTAPDGSPVTVLDDLVMRSRAGYAIQLHLRVLKPGELQRAQQEAAAQVARARAEQAAREVGGPAPKIEVVSS